MNKGIEYEIFWSEIGSRSGVPPSPGSKRSSLYFSLCSNHNRQQNKSRHFALKGLSDVLLTSKGENKAFPSSIPSMQCCAAVRATYRRQQIPTPLNLEWRRGGRGSLRGRRKKGREKSTPSLFPYPLPVSTPATQARGGVWILLFSEVTLYEYNVSTILSQIVAPPTQTEDSTRQIL